MKIFDDMSKDIENSNCDISDKIQSVLSSHPIAILLRDKNGNIYNKEVGLIYDKTQKSISFQFEDQSDNDWE
ncbi:hypothetical protein ACNF40_08665 [Cuniculiplasma sp. SKW4]|uniref:hypothetical protein n=1 Tax=Cuniculiplasma sp. SKW4 TaxID=3400171 RepID=UPI003FD0AB1C